MQWGHLFKHIFPSRLFIAQMAAYWFTKKWQSLTILNEKKLFSHYLLLFLYFLHFLKFCLVLFVQKVFSVIARYLTKNGFKYMHYTTQTQNFQFNISVTSWAWTNLTWDMLTESPGWCLCIHAACRLTFSFDSVVVRDKSQNDKYGKWFDLELTCDVIDDPEVNDIVLPLINAPGLLNAVWIL